MNQPIVERRAAPSRYRALSLSPAYEADKGRPEHPMTAEGKLIHKALETNDPSGLNEFQRVLFDKAQEWVNKIFPKSAVRMCEVRFPILGADFGFGDLIGLDGNVGLYADYKLGAKAQTAVEENLAAQAYALGMFTTFPYLQQVRVFYLYPRLDFVDACSYYRADIDRIVASIQFVKARHDRATPETCTFHEDTCTYCKHLATCPTAHKVLAPAIKSYADGHGLPALPDLSLVTDPEKWARLLEVKPVLEQMANSIFRHALKFSETNEVPGWERQYVEGRREVVDVRKFVETLVAKGVDSAAVLENCITVSLTDALELLKATLPRGKKAKGVEEFLDQLSEGFVIERKSGYYKLTKEKLYGRTRLEQTDSGPEQLAAPGDV